MEETIFNISRRSFEFKNAIIKKIAPDIKCFRE